MNLFTSTKTLIAAGLLFLTGFFVTVKGQVSAAFGNELTQVKITVSRNEGVDDTGEKKFKTLPISDAPLLEAGDVLTIKFCEKCQGRAFADLGYQRLLVFFINPASVASDLKADDSAPVLARESAAKANPESAKAIAEVRFDGDLKSKKNQLKIYGEHQFLVPYRSIPLIFLVSSGDYKAELRKTILEKQADVLKLSEQATLISRLPEAVSFLLEIKSALQTPAASNPDFMQSFVQRAQFFRFNQTNCFRQNYLYPTDEAKLGCLVKNVNPDQLTSDIESFSLARFARTGGAETVAQLRSRYNNLSIFFDAAGMAIEIVGRLFQKKPLNIQLATLQPVPASAVNQSNIDVKSSADKSGFSSLRQLAVNTPSGTEKALIIAPLKWREAEEIVQLDDLQKVEAFPACRCLHQGKNTFWLDTDNPLVRQELKTASLVLQKKSDSSQTLAFEKLPVSLADGSLTLALDDSTWRKVKDWREAVVKISFGYAFEKIEKEIDLNVPAAPNWQILKNWNDPVKREEKTVLRLTSNAGKRECLDKIVLTDERKQSVELSPLGGHQFGAHGILEVSLSAKLLEKLASGKIILNIYENGNIQPTGKMSFTLVNR